MKDFPEFMKSTRNRIDGGQQHTEDIEGYYFEGKDGSQLAFWTCHTERASKMHTHDFDEYMICAYGKYTVHMNGASHVLMPGDELFIPKGTQQWGECIAGTRTIHAFGGQRIRNDG